MFRIIRNDDILEAVAGFKKVPEVGDTVGLPDGTEVEIEEISWDLEDDGEVVINCYVKEPSS